MSNNKADILPIHLKDFIATTANWSSLDVGVYMRLLFEQWANKEVLSNSELFQNASQQVKSKFKIIDVSDNDFSVLQNQKMERVRKDWDENFVYKQPKEVKEKTSNKQYSVIIKDTFEKRKLAFAETLKPYINKPYKREMLLEFYDYWVEPNNTKTLFRKELEKTWDLERRLRTWNKNNTQTTFKNGNSEKRGNANSNQAEINTLVEKSIEYLRQRGEQFNQGGD